MWLFCLHLKINSSKTIHHVPRKTTWFSCCYFGLIVPPFSWSPRLDTFTHARFNHSEVQFWLFLTFQAYSMTVFQPGVQAPSAPLPDLFSLPPVCARCCCQSLTAGAPRASPCHSLAVAPHGPQSILPTAPERKSPWSHYFQLTRPFFWFLVLS